MAAMPLVCSAQTWKYKFNYSEVCSDPKYLIGAVKTTSDGMAYIERFFTVEGATPAQIISEVNRMFVNVEAPAKYTEVTRTDRMIIYRIEDELVFKRTYISTNVSTLLGRLMVTISNEGVCKVKFDNISYSTRGGGIPKTTILPHETWQGSFSATDNRTELITAEETITDEIALKARKVASYKDTFFTSGTISQQGIVDAQTTKESVFNGYVNTYDTKLARWSAKYRVRTIDYVEGIVEKLQKQLDK